MFGALIREPLGDAYTQRSQPTRNQVSGLAMDFHGFARLNSIRLRAAGIHDCMREVDLKVAKGAREEERHGWERDKRDQLRAAVEQKTEGGRELSRAAVYDLIDKVMRGETAA